MSVRQNDYPVHAWRAHVGEGFALTACGRVIEERRVTTDCCKVTCRVRGCKAKSDQQMRDRLTLLRITDDSW